MTRSGGEVGQPLTVPPEVGPGVYLPERVRRFPHLVLARTASERNQHVMAAGVVPPIGPELVAWWQARLLHHSVDRSATVHSFPRRAEAACRGTELEEGG